MNFKRYHESKNLFDITSATSGKYVRDTDGSLGNFDDTSASDYIDVSNITTLYPQYFTEQRPVRQWAAFYNGSKSFVSGFSGYNQAITVPNDAAYVRLTVDNSYVSNFTVSSTELEKYEPYSSEVWHDIPYYIHNTATDTLTTLPADIYANGTTATVGLKGQMEQSGTPSPTTPIQPSECGERTGNLFDITAYSVYKDYPSVNGVSFTAEDNNYTINGNATANATVYLLSNGSFPIDGEMTLSFAYSSGTIKGAFQSTKLGWKDLDAGRKTFTFDNDTITNIWIQVPSGKSADHIKLNFIIKTGSTALPYEPYGYKIPILSNSTTTNVYLGEVQTTRRIYKFILDGTEDWKVLISDNSKYYLIYLENDYLRADSQITYICSHYSAFPQTNSATSVPNLQMSMAYSTTAQRLYIADANYTTAESFKTYLQQQYAAGTPVCVWYVLATPETAVVNEPLRKIGDYADEVSGISIPVIAGANTISVGTTIQPSEVSVNYKGWHPVTDVHERENGAWD